MNPGTAQATIDPREVPGGLVPLSMSWTSPPGLSMGLHEGLAHKYLVRWCTKGNPVDINKAMESLRRLAEEVARCGDEEEKGPNYGQQRGERRNQGWGTGSTPSSSSISGAKGA